MLYSILFAYKAAEYSYYVRDVELKILCGVVSVCGIVMVWSLMDAIINKRIDKIIKV
jgi:hypothetical protein